MSKLHSDLINYWKEHETRSFLKRAIFVFDAMADYYGIKRKDVKLSACIVEAKTLESIGNKNGLTRERIRQIINKGSIALLNSKYEHNPYKALQEIFKQKIDGNEFLGLKEFISHPYVKEFKPNVKGLLAVLSHAGINHVMYRNNYYLYMDSETADTEVLIEHIQEENKKNRKQKTIEHAASMAKTVTYVPEYIRNKLLSLSENNNEKLNSMYTKILEQFNTEKPFVQKPLFFSKKTEWRVPRIKKAWVQVGLYIDKDLYLECVGISEKYNTSVMNYIGCAFAWHSLKNDCEIPVDPRKNQYKDQE